MQHDIFIFAKTKTNQVASVNELSLEIGELPHQRWKAPEGLPLRQALDAARQRQSLLQVTDVDFIFGI